MKRLLSLLLLATGIAAQAQTTILFEDFQSGTMPAGWTQQTLASDGGWLVGNSTQLSSQWYSIPSHTTFAATNDDACQCNKSADLLILPALNLSSYSAVFLKTDAYYEGTSNYGPSVSYLADIATIEVSTNGGSTWTTVDSVPNTWYQNGWLNNIEFDLTAYAGMSNVLIAFKYNDNSALSGNDGYGFAVDNVQLYEPITRDLKAVSITNEVYDTIGTQYLQGYVRNLGATPVTVYTLNYKIDNGSPVSSVINGNISPFDSVPFTHPVSWNAANGVHQVKAWVSNVNNMGADMNASNDTVASTMSYGTMLSPRNALIEYFSSANCPSCPTASGWLNPLYNANSSRATYICYHDLLDQMYYYNTSQSDFMYNMNGVVGMPTILCDTKDIYPYTAQQDLIDKADSVPALFDIGIYTSLTSSMIDINVELVPKVTFFAGNVRLVVAVAEDVTYSTPPGSNGEVFFPGVMRRILPGTSFTSLGMPAEGQLSTHHFTFNLDTVVDPANTHVLAWVEDANPRKVHQSLHVKAGMSIPVSGMPEYVNDELSVYPNPSGGNFFIGSDKAFDEGASLFLYDLTGRMMMQQELAAGARTVQVNAGSLPAGMYFYRVTGTWSASGRVVIEQK